MPFKAVSSLTRHPSASDDHKKAKVGHKLLSPPSKRPLKEHFKRVLKDLENDFRELLKAPARRPQKSL